jgi:hypothetical protein
MGPQSDLHARIDEELEAALDHAEDDTAKYHIRSAAQKVAIAKEDRQSPDPVEEPAE